MERSRRPTGDTSTRAAAGPGLTLCRHHQAGGLTAPGAGAAALRTTTTTTSTSTKSADWPRRVDLVHVLKFFSSGLLTMPDEARRMQTSQHATGPAAPGI